MDSIAYFFRIFITIFKWRLHILEEGELQVFKYFSKRGAEKSLYILGGGLTFRGDWMILQIKLALHSTNYITITI